MSVSKLKEVACQAIEQHAHDLNEISQQIWSHPELNFEEHHAHKVLTDYLEKKGFKVKRHYTLDTAFRATWGEGESTDLPRVAILCEYDALPEIGHACGHNLIAEAGVAAALGVKAAMEAAGKPIGKLTVLGTPAEEGGGGKVDMIEKGAFKDLDVAMMTHPSPIHQTRPAFTAITGKSEVHGKATHAAAFPWEGVNALDAAVMCYQSVSNMRQQFKPSWRVHGIITKGGTKPNIIPDNTELEFYMRAPTDTELWSLTEKVSKCFQAAATATGCTVETEAEKRPYSSLLSNGPLADTYDDNARQVGVNVVPTVDFPAGASTDMGNVSRVLPSLHPVYSLHTKALNHSKEFTAVTGSPEAQPCTLNQGKILAMTTIDVFTSPDLLTKVKAAFEKDKKDKN